jgi:hypothetical protein
MVVDTFNARYLGDRFVKLHWHTACEQDVQGFILRRRIKGSGLCINPSDLEFREIRRFGPIFDSSMYSKGNRSPGFGYDVAMPKPDTVIYRDVVYEYELSGLFNDNTRKYLDTTEVYIPNSLILSATVFPNPVTDTAHIVYTVSDQVRITAKVYDLTGKELAVLMDKEYKARNNFADPANPQINEGYRIAWLPNTQAAQGLYLIVMIAYPVDDANVELSRAIMKVQILR